MKKFNKAQSLIEYGLIIGVITVALVTMQTYFKRGIQSMVKVVADDYGQQGEPVRDVEIAVKKKVYYEGYKDGNEDRPPQLAVNSKGTSESSQTKINQGDSSTLTKMSTSNTISGEESSFAVGADYRDRKIE